MTSIRAIGATATPVVQRDRIAARAPDSTPTPTINSVDRVAKLTRQLDAGLTDKLARIREQISPGSSPSAGAAPASRRLDLQA